MFWMLNGSNLIQGNTTLKKGATDQPATETQSFVFVKGIYYI